MGQSANVCDRHGRNIGTSGTSVEARTESPCCVGTYELGVRTVAVTDVVVPGPRSRSYQIVLRYTTHCTLQSVVSS